MLHDKRVGTAPIRRYRPEDFEFIDERHARCPAGRLLTGSGTRYTHPRGALVLQYRARDEDCQAYAQRHRCLNNPEQGKGRQVSRFGRALVDETDPSERVRRTIDSERGRRLYSRRIAMVEPVLAIIRIHKAMNRFTLRGRTKVSKQWHLYCLAHKIEKVATRTTAGQ